MDVIKQKNNPVISIIVPVFNAATCLEAALDSIISQSYENYELIIVDGGSTDGSLKIIERFVDKINVLISETDKGIYDAMNKGIDKAKGDWLYFLGADDKLNTDILKKIIPFLHSSFKVVFGDVLFENGHRMKSYLGTRTILQNTLHHQSAFYHRSNFHSFRYDTSLQIIADYELNLIIYTKKLSVLYVPEVIAKCYAGGTSSQLGKSLQETNTVRKRYIKSNVKSIILYYTLNIYYFQKQIRRFLYDHKV